MSLLKKSLWIVALLVSGLCAALTLQGEATVAAELVLYSGRSKSLIEPLIRQFEKETGITVKVRYGKTSQLALAMQEEGQHSPADIFWAQDAGALGTLSKAGLLRHIPERIMQWVPDRFRSPSGYWVATSGRARVLAYSPQRVEPDQLPRSVFDLTDAKWKRRVGWAPTNASFHAFVTAMRQVYGEDKTRRWLVDMKKNGTRRYAKNTPILKALADGEIDLGLPNHYYLLRFRRSDKNFPVNQRFFDPGDVGNLVNVAGLGILRDAKHPEAAQRFVEFTLSMKAQQFLTSNVFEYPVIDQVITNPHLVDQEQLLRLAPDITLDSLADLKGTLDLLKEAELL